MKKKNHLKVSLMHKDERPSNPCERCSVKQGTVELHTCPYSCEINENYEANCNCCHDCERVCAEEI